MDINKKELIEEPIQDVDFVEMKGAEEKAVDATVEHFYEEEPEPPKAKKKVSVKRWVAIGVVAAIILGIVYLFFGGRNDGNPQIPISTITIEPVDLVQRFSASGTLASGDSQPMILSTDFTGAAVANVNVKAGEIVAKGQLLATFDTSDLAYAVQKAEASYNQVMLSNNDAYANADVLSGLTREKDALNVHLAAQEAELENLKATLPETDPAIGAQKDAIKITEDSLAALEPKIKAAEPFYLTQAVRVQMANNLEMARKTWEDAQVALNVASAGVKAPIDGLLSSFTLQKGGNVTGGMQVGEVDSTSNIEVALPLSKYEIEKVQIGQKATVKVGNKEYTGTVVRIDHSTATPSAGEVAAGTTTSKYINAYVQIDNPSNEIFLGLEATVSVVTAERRSVIAVPFTAVVTDVDGTYCYVMENGEMVQRPVTTGVSDDTSIEILTGLNVGDEVLLTPASIGNNAEAGGAAQFGGGAGGAVVRVG